MKYALSTALVSTLFLASGVFAADDVAGHPRVNQVNNRIEHQQQRIDAGVANGTITEKQAAHDEKRLEKTEQKLSEDEAKHNGHITKAEQHHLNKRLNKSSHRIHKQRHDGVHAGQ